MNKAYILLIFSLSMLACTDDKPEKYFDENQEKSLRVQYGALLEKKPDHARANVWFDPAMVDIYTNRAVYYTHRRVNLGVGDSVYKVLLLRKENWSLLNKHRMIGISFKLENDTIRNIDPVFYTPAVSKEEALELGDKLYDEWLSTGNVDKYFDQRKIMEWPNSEVYWDKEKEQWEIKDGSPLKELQQFTR